MASINPSDYSHSPIHTAILARDHTALQLFLSSLPHLSDPSTILTESASLSEESTADTISAAIDRRDVPNRDTPLHLAVRLSDPNAVELLMSSGADWSLQNSLGWSPLQDAICAREEALAKIIVRHSHSLAFAKWRRRLPRIIATMRRMRDFYMELTFNFESSVIPFISRIAPSDTYKIWKRGANLRTDMTLAGFDGFKIQRSDQSVLFLGEGSEDGDIEIPAGALCIVSHKKKEVMNALEHAGAPATEKEIQHEVNSMLKTNILRPGIDVTKAVLLPQMTWRRQERKDSVGPWKAKVYDMHHVVVSVKTRQVPSAASATTASAATAGAATAGAATASAATSSPKSDSQSECDEFADVLTVEERKQLEDVLKMECPDVIDDNVPNNYVGRRHSCYEQREISENEPKQEEGRVVGINGGQKKIALARSSLCEEKVSDLLGDSPPPPPPRSLSRPPGRPSMDSKRRGSRKSGKDEGKESEYKKGLRPVLWLSPNFPLRTEELLPLLDILANKVKAIRRLRELLTTKLPPGTFPVKVAIPVVPTIRVIVTFTKFEELEPEEEFSTPPTSPEKKSPKARSGNSWHKWMKGHDQDNNRRLSGSCSSIEDIQDPFKIPPDYKWITLEMKKKRMLQKRRKASKGRVQTK